MASYDIPNPPTNLGLNYFRGVTNNYDSIAKSSRFAARIFYPSGLDRRSGFLLMDPKEFTYLCEATDLPGRAFTNVEVRYYGPTQKLPVNSQYEDINMSFICRTGFPEREFFDDWMEIINPTTSFDFNYRDKYSTTIELFQFSEGSDPSNKEAKATYQFTLFDAYPILINPQPVTWADDAIQRLVVTFTYTKWRRASKDTNRPIRTFEMVQSGPTEISRTPNPNAFTSGPPPANAPAGGVGGNANGEPGSAVP